MTPEHNGTPRILHPPGRGGGAGEGGVFLSRVLPIGRYNEKCPPPDTINPADPTPAFPIHPPSFIGFHQLERSPFGPKTPETGSGIRPVLAAVIPHLPVGVEERLRFLRAALGDCESLRRRPFPLRPGRRDDG